MINRYYILFILIFTFFAVSSVQAQNCEHEHISRPDAGTPDIRFAENKGQWHENVRYRLRFNNGGLFLEDNKFTYVFFDGYDLDEYWKNHHGMTNGDTLIIDGHAFQVNFKGANPSPALTTDGRMAMYENYYKGQDPSKWASRVRSYEHINYLELYNGIDLSIYRFHHTLKYDFKVEPGANPNDIVMEFDGVEELFVDEDGELHYKTSVNEVIEQQPFAYQMVNGKKEIVACNFKVKGNQVSFKLPDGYDKNKELVIDPILVFATFTGSTADNFGYTATYDNQGFFYAGGIARGAGYVLTPGAFQNFYAGGFTGPGSFPQGFDADISITKYDAAGGSLIYSTYLGGAVNDQPHSLVVNDNDQLAIYGRSNSTDFPVSTNAYDQTHNGGMDMIVTKFSPDGATLIGSTYVGGSDDDATNISPDPVVYSSLKFNYADDARGEIITDAANNVYVASCTRSGDFPTTGGAFQGIQGGGQDACLVKLNADLSNLTFSTFMGGSNNDAAYSVVNRPNGDIYVVGGTASSNFPGVTGGLNPGFQGGVADGYILRFNSTATSLLGSTFIGTTEYDQCYFVQLDGDNNVYVTGQTSGGFTYPQTGGVYGVANSGQFITSLTPDLSTINWSTTFGKGDGDPDLSLTAFLVDDCRNIYVSGWGGTVNNNGLIGNTFNLPVTNDAFQSTTDGSDFYFMVLGADAANLRYATFFGGTLSSEHVDGGTSRFSKEGVIYQAVCAGCGGNSDFPTTPGAWSNTNNSFNCNLGSAKFAFETLEVDVDVEAQPDTTACVPFTVTFDANGINAIDYFWDFGNGTFSFDPFPTTTYDQVGTYTVKVVGIDTISCDTRDFIDSSFITIIIEDDSIVADFGYTIINDCPPYRVQFNNNSTGATDYFWNFGDASGTNAVENPLHDYSLPGTYTVELIAENDTSCNKYDTTYATIQFLPELDLDISLSDSSGCVPFTVTFTNNSTGSGASSYVWDFDDSSPTTTDVSPTHTFNNSGVYNVSLQATDPNTCNVNDSLTIPITVQDDTITANYSQNILSSCDSFIVAFTDASVNATNYFWDFGDNTPISNDQNPVHEYDSSGTFTITLIIENPLTCNERDTLSSQVVVVTSVRAEITANDTFGCAPLAVDFTNLGRGGVDFTWDFAGLGGSSAEDTTFTFTAIGTYQVILTAIDSTSCNISDTDTIEITITDDSLTAAFSLTVVEENCDSLVVTVTDQSTNNEGVQWFMGDSTVTPVLTAGSSFTHTYYSQDTFIITMVANSGLTCNEFDQTRDTVLIAPRVEALFDPLESCTPLLESLNNNSTFATSYLWDLPNGTSTDASPLLDLTVPGDYDITLTAYNPNACNDSSTITETVTVHGLPTASFETDSTEYDIFDEVTFTNQSTAGSYDWDFADGESSTEVNPIHSYADTGVFEPCLTVTDINSCQDDTCVLLRVNFVGAIGLPNAFSPNGDGINEVLYVRGFGLREIELRIYNRWGELVFETNDQSIGWDGTYKNTGQEMEVYTYTLKGYYEDGTETPLQKGNITLLR